MHTEPTDTESCLYTSDLYLTSFYCGRGDKVESFAKIIELYKNSVPPRTSASDDMQSMPEMSPDLVLYIKATIV